MKLGIIGGVGPLAGYDFGKRLTSASPAKTDQDHIETILLSDTKIPDRTSFILGKTSESPLPKLKTDVQTLNSLNVDRIAVICNTAHYFYTEMAANSRAHIYNMIDITLRNNSNEKIGLVSTQGTRDSKIYDMYTSKYNVELVNLDDAHQEIATEIIYSQVKKGQLVDKNDFTTITDYLFAQGCSKIILGCTELSTAKEQFKLNEAFVDPIEELINEIINEFY